MDRPLVDVDGVGCGTAGTHTSSPNVASDEDILIPVGSVAGKTVGSDLFKTSVFIERDFCAVLKYGVGDTIFQDSESRLWESCTVECLSEMQIDHALAEERQICNTLIVVQT